MLLLIAYTKNIDQLKKYLYMLYSSLVISKHKHEPKVSRKNKRLKEYFMVYHSKGLYICYIFHTGLQNHLSPLQQ